MKNLIETYRSKLIGVAVLLTVFASAALPAHGQTANLSRLVVVGDSLLAGFQNGSLRGSQQVHGIAAVIARQAGVPLAQPLIGEPGIPNALQLISVGPPLVIAPLPGQSVGRIDYFTQPTNLSVPGHTVADALSLRPGNPPQNLTDLILGFPGLFGGISRSQVEWAEALQPTTIIVWLGPNDTLGAALDGDASLVTPEAEFRAAYQQLMDRLAATGASLVVANIPDVTTIAYLTPADQVAASLNVPLAFVGPLLGIRSGDYVTPGAFAQIEAILTGASTGPLSPDVVLDAGEVASIQNATQRFNAFIAAKANEKNAALVDTYTLLNTFKTRGLVVNGQRLTTGFLGGIFSLDGFHPTNTGAAATANEFIHAINRKFGNDIPRANIVAIARQDPLVLPRTHPPSALLRGSALGAAKHLSDALRH
jgi:lysophospholipase L1-like esterase